MGLLLPSSAIEVFIPLRGEAEVASYPASVEAPKAEGTLIVTNYRVAVVGEAVATIYRGAAEQLRKTIANVGYESMVSVASKVEKKLFLLEKHFLEITYEDVEGIIRRLRIELPRGKATEAEEAVKISLTRFRERGPTQRLPVRLFLGFVEFLAVDKALRPVYYDSVSRCIAVGSSYFCVKDIEWSVEGSADILAKARSWVEEYRARRGGTA